jgi:hypothetical protein
MVSSSVSGLQVFALYTGGKPKQPRRGFSMIVGSGKFRYRVNADWAKLPEAWSFKEVGGGGSTATTTSMYDQRR